MGVFAFHTVLAVSADSTVASTLVQTTRFDRLGVKAD